MSDNNELFLEMLKEITKEIKELKKDNAQSSITLSQINSTLQNEVTLRLRNEKDIESIKLKLQIDEKERDEITVKLYKLESKAEKLEAEIKESKEFQNSMRKNLWKTLWWILGVASAAVTAGITVFQSFFTK